MDIFKNAYLGSSVPRNRVVSQLLMRASHRFLLMSRIVVGRCKRRETSDNGKQHRHIDLYDKVRQDKAEVEITRTLHTDEAMHCTI